MTDPNNSAIDLIGNPQCLIGLHRHRLHQAIAGQLADQIHPVFIVDQIDIREVQSTCTSAGDITDTKNTLLAVNTLPPKAK